MTIELTTLPPPTMKFNVFCLTSVKFSSMDWRICLVFLNFSTDVDFEGRFR